MDGVLYKIWITVSFVSVFGFVTTWGHGAPLIIVECFRVAVACMTGVCIVRILIFIWDN